MEFDGYLKVRHVNETFWIQPLEITDEHIFGIVSNNLWDCDIKEHDIVYVDKNTLNVISWFKKKF